LRPTVWGAGVGVARIHRGEGSESVLVDRFEQQRELRVGDDDIGRGRRLGQPLARVAVGVGLAASV